MSIEMWRIRKRTAERRAFAHRILHVAARRNEEVPADWITGSLDDERLDYVLSRTDAYRRQRRIAAEV